MSAPILWEGIEVEGRHCGKWTLFVHGYHESLEDIEELAAMYEQVYFARPFIVQHGYRIPLYYVGTRALVTVEVQPEWIGEVPPMLMSQAHLMVVLDAPPMVDLKPGDEVRWDGMDRNVLTWVMDWGIRTHPEDYACDRILVYSE